MHQQSIQMNEELLALIGHHTVGSVIDSVCHALRLAKWDGVYGHDPLRTLAKLEVLAKRVCE